MSMWGTYGGFDDEDYLFAEYKQRKHFTHLGLRHS